MVEEFSIERLHPVKKNNIILMSITPYWLTKMYMGVYISILNLVTEWLTTEFQVFTVWFGLVWFGLCCLMTPGLRKDIRCHV